MNIKRVLRFYFDFHKCLIVIKKTKFAIGFLIGILLSLLTNPPFDDCSSYSVFLKKSSEGSHFSNEVTQFESIYFWFQNIINSDFNPVVRLKFNSTIKSSFSSNLISSVKRPRFYSEELGFKDDLLIAVLTSGQTLSNLGKAINSTLSQFSDKLLFFTQTPVNLDSNLIQLPSIDNIFNQTKLKNRLFFRMLTYLTTQEDVESHLNYFSTYRFFFFISDDTYVQGKKLTKLLSNYSSSDILFILGSTQESLKNEPCSQLNVDLKLGLIINDNFWKRCNLDWQCWIYHCQNGLYSTYNLKFDQSDKLIVNHDLFKSSLITYSLFTSIMYYNIHYLNIELNLKQVTSTIKKLDKKIESFGQFLAIDSWPVSINPSVKPSDRFNVNHWSFINDSHIFFPNDFDVISLINFHDQSDLNQVKDFCSKYLLKHFNLKSINSIQFSNIYRKFDATRGLEYIFDANIYKTTSQLIKKRIQVLKPLNPIELIIKLPYVTENNRLTLFLTVTSEKQAESLTFFITQFIDICLKRPKTQTVLIIILIQPPNNPHFKQFSSIKSMILSAQSKYKASSFKIFLLNVESGQGSKIPNEIGLIDLIWKKYFNLVSKSIIMNSKINCLMNLEFLNRVQINTIKGHQVFFPIPFLEYKLRPNDGQSSSNYFGFDIKKSNGRFNEKDFRFYSFYFDDYWKARQMIQDQFPIVNTLSDLKKDMWYDSSFDIFQLFLSYNCHNYKFKLNILRAVEPELKLRYFEFNCEEQESNLFSIQTCNESFFSFGSASQLAQLILDYKKSKNNEENNDT